MPPEPDSPIQRLRYDHLEHLEDDQLGKLRESLQALIASASRTANTNKPQTYWYPLSVATYDVEEILAAVESLCSFRTTMWEKTALFERRFAEQQGYKEAVMVNSGSSADLLIAFAITNPKAALLQPSDEILVPSVTWPTQIWSAMMAGLTVQFVDTDPLTLNMDLRDLEAKITDRTRAVSIVHLMGNPCDMNAIQSLCRKHDLLLLEDCCEALGAEFKAQPVGSFGVAASFSFFFSHHITTMEGGMICCADEGLSDLFRLLRAHGWARNTRYEASPPPAGLDPRYTFVNWGFNVRPTELNAAFGIVQLERLPQFHRHRVANAHYLSELLVPCSELLQPMQVHPDAECSWFAFPLLVTPNAPFSRNEIVSYLEEQGVETRPIVAGSMARQPAIALFPKLKVDELLGADIVHERGFYVGIHSCDERPRLERLAETLVKYVAQAG